MDTSTATARETIAYIQHQALTHAGIAPQDLIAHYRRTQGNIAKLAVEYADRSLEPEDPDLQQYADVSKLRRQVPTPFQDPYVYAWLKDFWRQHTHSLFGPDQAYPVDFIMASAPTGRFNALAVPASDKAAIIVEDGLVFFARKAAGIIAKVLYEHKEGSRYVTRDVHPSGGVGTLEHTAITALSELVLDYLLTGYTPLAEAELTTEGDFAVRHLIFLGFMSFVFEHEVYHIREFSGLDKITHTRAATVKHRFEALWQFVEKAFQNETRVTFDRASCERLFNAHSEEYFADLSGFVSVISLGNTNNTLLPSIDGALMFFFLADAIDHARRTILDKEAYDAMEGMSEVALILNGLVLEETHPYPTLRLKSLAQADAAIGASTRSVINEETAALRALFNRVNALTTQAIVDRALTPEDLHKKWTFDAKSLFP